MRKYGPLVASAGVLALFLQTSLPTQGQSVGNAKPLLAAELTETGDGALTLDVTFYGAHPKPDKAEETLRQNLESVTVMHSGKDITAKAWFRTSADSSDRQAVALSGGTESLLYVAKDQSIRSAGDDEAPSADTPDAADTADTADDVATIVTDEKIVQACAEFPQEQLPVLAGVALEKRGQTKRNILNAMRTWCKENDITASRACIFAIARAVIAIKNTPSVAPKDRAVVATQNSPNITSGDSAAVMSRGKASFTGSNHCVNCHRTGGRGGPRGPSLADDEWLHCDGSIEGIKKVILAGVPQNKMKNKSHPFPMGPNRTLAGTQELTDLAAYVHSLSRH